ncbi:B12-binding domain-containing radical SAM protein [Gorillibacterium sp. sgz500922]|uniref:B12-binding domain-containing radical SAM protein n=1 Tax=Gorillibacterium sp. sgz500922 TaxID=3446694 RepID=UPI003F67CC01
MKLRILLIQPENRTLHRFRRKQLNNFSQITMPYLAAFVDEGQYDLTLVDEYSQRIPYGRTFDLVAITVNTPNAYHCYEIADAFRAKGAKVVFGGPHATLLPDEAGRRSDHVIVGEAEETWPRFLRDFAEGKAQARYVSETPPTLEGLPEPRWDLLRGRSRLMKGAVFATRGCPYRCRYCNLKQIYHDCFRSRPVSEVIGEIRAMKARHFVFWDDNFFADAGYALELMKELAPLRKRWAAQVTLADCANEKLLKAAQEAGCLYLFVGLESFSEASLGDAGKRVNRVRDYEAIIQSLHRHNIMIQAGIVFGFDSDTEQVFGETLRACERLGIDGVTVSLLTPLPRTPIYEQLKAEGRLRSEEWNRYNGKTQVAFDPKRLTPEQLYEGYMEFRRSFYSLRSFVRRMRVSRTHPLYNLAINLGYRWSIR